MARLWRCVNLERNGPELNARWQADDEHFKQWVLDADRQEVFVDTPNFYARWLLRPDKTRWMFQVFVADDV